MSVTDSYDKLFKSMFALSAQTTPRREPDSLSAWFLLTGIESANVIAIFYLYLLVGPGEPYSGRPIIVGMFLVGAINALYVSLRGRYLVGVPLRPLQHRLALSYAAISLAGLFLVVGLMFFDVASR